MAHKEILEKRKLVKDYLDNLRINDAISTVNDMLIEASCRDLLTKTEKEAETFKYLVHYFVECVKDPNRTRMLNEISERLLMLADSAVRAAEGKDSSEYYYSVLRFADFRKEKLSDLIKEYSSVVSELSLVEAGEGDTTSLRKQKEAVLERFFNSLFTSFGDTAAYSELTDYLTSGYADRDIAALSLSALSLGLLYFYESGKISVLLDVIENSDDERMVSRALVGLVFALLIHDERIRRDSTITARLSLWGDSIDIYRRLKQTIRVIAGTRDTERVSSKIKDEVLPELMKLRPQIMEKLSGADLSEMDMEAMQDNPEWEEMLHKNGLDKKMQELSEMHSEGADFMMVTFSNLKQFPFFNSAANWFLPFDVNHTAIALPEDMKPVIDLMQQTGVGICDSDLYSLALSAARMPEAQRKIISSQLSMQQTQLSEEMKSRILSTSTPEFDTEVLKVVRDLYRFFKLFRKREGFIDPFARPLSFTEMPVIGNLMKDEEVLELIGEFYFKRGFYAEALPLLQMLSEVRSEDASIWEKIGFCFQSLGKNREALDAYTKASLLHSPGPWLIKKLAVVNRLLGNLDEAINYYRQVLDMDPDNFAVIFNLGSLELDAGNPEAALSQFYHANYLRPSNQKVLRAIAWAELMNGNLEKSADYYNKLIGMNPTASDYMNAGHAQLLLGHNKEAINLYRLSAADRPEDFRLAFLSDLPQLMESGLERNTALLALEASLTK